MRWMGKQFPVAEDYTIAGMISMNWTQGFLREQRFGFEEVTFCCYSKAAQRKELADFEVLLVGPAISA